MKELDEAERKAASILTEQWHGQDTVELAEIVLAMVPVVRAAKAVSSHIKMPSNGDWACAECKPYSDCLVDGFRCRQHTFLDAIKQMRRALEQRP